MSSSERAQPRSSRIHCFGFYPWKHGYVRKYLSNEPYSVRFEISAKAARLRGFDDGSRILVWGLRERESVRRLAAAHGVPIWRMEDGFLRSVGLGSDRHAPASLVIDRQGIYYDPTRPSDLESILASHSFSEEELVRARALRETIVTLGVSKYNVGDTTAKLPAIAPGKRVVLVPGQVEDDASIRLGCVDVRTNLALLRAAREVRPGAFIIFKPHPDVVSKNRKGEVPMAEAEKLADAVVVDAPLPACLALAHEVHTMTSLVGFEGLLRGLEVHAYGLPFYAGWGLTRDRHSLARRTRKLSLDQLVAGALIRYPLYLHPSRDELTTPEEVVSALRAEMNRMGNRPVKRHWLARRAHKLKNAIVGMLDGL
jgi:capsular polysaccharide export protein